MSTSESVSEWVSQSIRLQHVELASQLKIIFTVPLPPNALLNMSLSFSMFFSLSLSCYMLRNRVVVSKVLHNTNSVFTFQGGWGCRGECSRGASAFLCFFCFPHPVCSRFFYFAIFASIRHGTHIFWIFLFLSRSDLDEFYLCEKYTQMFQIFQIPLGVVWKYSSWEVRIWDQS